MLSYHMLSCFSAIACTLCESRKQAICPSLIQICRVVDTGARTSMESLSSRLSSLAHIVSQNYGSTCNCGCFAHVVCSWVNFSTLCRSLLSHPRFFSVSTLNRPTHRAKVVYDIEGFLEKNNDSLHDNLLDLLDATADPFLRQVVEFVDPEAGSESPNPHPDPCFLPQALPQAEHVHSRLFQVIPAPCALLMFYQ